MNYYIKQHVFSFADSFDIYTENQEVVYQCKGEFFRLLKHLHLYEVCNGNEVAYISERFRWVLKGYEVYIRGEYATQIEQKLGFFEQRLELPDLGWHVVGNYLAHDFAVYDNDDDVVFTLHKEWLAWGDTYEIEINDAYDEVLCLAVAITIDATLDINSTGANAK